MSRLSRSRGLLPCLLLPRRPHRAETRPLYREFRLRLSEPRSERADPPQPTWPDDLLFSRGPGIQMKSSLHSQTPAVVAGVPRAVGATSFFPPRPTSSESSQPLPSFFTSRTNWLPQESLGCSGLQPAPLKELLFRSEKRRTQ